jgi:hypothetical protein
VKARFGTRNPHAHNVMSVPNVEDKEYSRRPFAFVKKLQTVALVKAASRKFNKLLHGRPARCSISYVRYSLDKRLVFL